ncbi:unnamed protein product, partial [marine sediment metagenome]
LYPSIRRDWDITFLHYLFFAFVRTANISYTLDVI